MLTYNSNRKACKVVTALADGQKHRISILEGLSAIELSNELAAAGLKLCSENNFVWIELNNEETKL